MLHPVHITVANYIFDQNHVNWNLVKICGIS